MKRYQIPIRYEIWIFRYFNSDDWIYYIVAIHGDGTYSYLHNQKNSDLRYRLAYEPYGIQERIKI